MSRRCAIIGVTVCIFFCGCEKHLEEPISPTYSTNQEKPATSLNPLGIVGPCVRSNPAASRPLLSKDWVDPICPPDPGKKKTMKTGKLLFQVDSGVELTVEIAQDDQDRARGLMYRKQLGENRGMIFLFEESEEHSFWMHNTCISLDMIFVGSDGTIVGIEENTKTMSDDVYSVGCPSRYVIEVPAGWSKEHGIKPGQKITLSL